MSAQLKTHLAVHCGGRTMLEKMIDWETHVQILSSHQCDSRATKNSIFLGFKFGLRFLRILKLLDIYISFQAKVPFLCRSMEV